MSHITIKPIDKEIYQNDLVDFIPEKIIDVHTHIWMKSFVGSVPDLDKEKWPSRVASENLVETLISDYQDMLPGKEVIPCIFGYPIRSVDLNINNAYVSQAAKQHGFPGLLLSTPEMSQETLKQLVESSGFYGLKPYLSYSPESIPENEITIYDFLPRHQLEVANAQKWVVVLHVPRPARLRDPLNLTQLVEIDRDYPDIRLVIAHIGRVYCNDDIGEAFSVLHQTTNLMFDFSANTNSNAMISALQAVGTKRVVFGSDMPILKMRMRRICENGKYINLVPPGLYGDVHDDPHMREVSVEEGESLSFFLYEELIAFKQAAKSLDLHHADLNDIFYKNAATIFNL